MTDVKAIAINLPQFHPVPENDEWWGKGFTEWTNVTKAKPLFPGHYQPHLPSELGFYDLRLPEARKAQADLAKQYGIHGFCYYHYWFNGQRILERPVNDIVTSGDPDFPFCLCWANENWTRTWDGAEREVLLQQSYSPEDDRKHIRSLIPIFADPRYIRIKGKIAFFVYRISQLPDPAATAEIWRDEVARAGLGELFIGEFATTPPVRKSENFDAIVEFHPRPFRPSRTRALQRLASKVFCRSFARMRGTRQAAIHLYEDLREAASNHTLPSNIDPAIFFRCVTPGWDNSARRKNKPIIFLGSTPEQYEEWLREMADWTRRHHAAEEQYVFINAWNEWAEGNHLEPDRRNGLKYLEATARALKPPYG